MSTDRHLHAVSAEPIDVRLTHIEGLLQDILAGLQRLQPATRQATPRTNDRPPPAAAICTRCGGRDHTRGDCRR